MSKPRRSSKGPKILQAILWTSGRAVVGDQRRRWSGSSGQGARRQDASMLRRRPGVSRVLFLRWLPLGGGGHSSRPVVAGGLERLPGSSGGGAPDPPRGGRFHIVLHQVGFTMRSPSPGTRCALTAPFHPYRSGRSQGPAVCFLWHFPSSYPDWTLSSTLPSGARTFLPRPGGRRRPPHRLRRSIDEAIMAQPGPVSRGGRGRGHGGEAVSCGSPGGSPRGSPVCARSSSALPRRKGSRRNMFVTPRASRRPVGKARGGRIH